MYHIYSSICSCKFNSILLLEFIYSNSTFLKALSTFLSYDQSQIYCAMETTGTYWLSLFFALTDKGFNVSVFNPYQIKSFRGAYSNRKQKNDVIDSIIIANFLSFNGIQQTCLPNDDLLALKNSSKGRLGTDTVRKVKNLAKNSFCIKFTGDACSLEIKQFITRGT